MGFTQNLARHAYRTSSAGLVRLNGLVQRALFLEDLVDHVVPLSGLQQGDIVRLVRQLDGLWFYCRIERALERGDLLCTVVDTQSWPDLMLGGIMPGQAYVVPIDCALSVVTQTPPSAPAAATLR
jgi:hypothetical protein